MTATIQLHKLEISQRPRRTVRQAINGLLFAIMFNTGCIMLNAFQFICMVPLRLIPFGIFARLYDGGVRFTKGAFAVLLIFMCQCFAPTKLVVTFETEGLGKFEEEHLATLVTKDSKGNITLNLPDKSVLISNHQIYADWWYVWCLTYFMNTHRDVFIVLKKSLKWIPIVGWGMQIFNFIFLARSWASDRLQLSTQLAWLGQRAEETDTPLTFILYPEGTLVSPNTRPVSKKFAEKMAIPDMIHTLLPRSTGLHYTLRSLQPKIRKLKMIDITMSYPGIPYMKYGQSYYTLRSIFMDRIPPPAVHMHIRCFDVVDEVPLGDLGGARSDKLPRQGDPHAVEIDIPEDEKTKFDAWLRELWREKDILMTRYLETGSFVEDRKREVVIPVALRRRREAFNVFGISIPAVLGWALNRSRTKDM